MRSRVSSLVSLFPRVRIRMGAVAVCSGRILGEGVNTWKPAVFHKLASCVTSRRTNYCYKSAPQRSTVYIARLLKDGCSACARPFEISLARLKEAGVRTVVWTTWNGLIGFDRID